MKFGFVGVATKNYSWRLETSLFLDGLERKRFLMCKMYCCISMLLSLLIAPHALYADETTDYHQARTWFNQALDGKDDVLDRSMEQFEKLLVAHPENLVYRSYLGACQTLEGRDAWMPWNKIRYTEKGLDTIDKALDALTLKDDELNIEGVSSRLVTMLVAASAFIRVPDHIFHRRAKGKKLLDKIVKHRAYASTPVFFKTSVQQTLKIFLSQKST